MVLYDANIFQQDLKAAMNALEKDDYDNLNIFANRIMSNAHLAGGKEQMVCGIMLKDLALTLLPLPQKKNAKSKSTAKALAAGFLKKMYEQREEISTENLWIEYNVFGNSVLHHMLTDYEESAYSGKNSEFTHGIVKILLEKLDQEKAKLIDPGCLLLKGILNEISRLSKVHTCELSDEFAFALITALDRCYDYIVFVYRETDEFVNEVKTKIIPEIEKIIEIMKKVETNNGNWISDIDLKLFELSNKWRDYFLSYMELGSPVKEKMIRIPNESRKKLTEAIARSLEEELPTKNK